MMRKQTKVYQFDKQGNFVKAWNSLFSITRNHPNFDIRHIQESCKKKRTSADGFIWTFDRSEDLRKRLERIETKRIKRIAQFTKRGELLTTWESVGQLIRVLTPESYEKCGKEVYKERTIRQCCQQTRKTAYGFIWKYL